MPLLADYPDSIDQDRWLYQLAKARELGGDPAGAMLVMQRLVRDYPGSVHGVEAHFRLAEYYFSNRRYADAQLAYQQVVAGGTDSPYYLNALYMLGWSQFKQARYWQALPPFSAVLDRLVPADGQWQALPRAQQELVADSFRVMSISFSYLDGAASIARLIRQRGDQRFVADWHDQLASFYLDQERYTDSAATYRAFLQDYPQSPQAPAFADRLIGVYLQGEFFAEVIAEKSRFVDVFALDSDYWRSNPDPELLNTVRPKLQAYLVELARYHHASAQALADSGSEAEVVPDETVKARTEAFLQAAAYYDRYCNDFPLANDIVAQCFLAAETRYEAGQYQAAALRWCQLAWQFPADPQAAEAGYAAILAYQQLPPPVPALIETQWRFATVFSTDARAPLVLANAAVALYGEQRYSEAVEAAQRLVDWQPPLPASARQQALTLLANSHFALADYVAAERYLRQLLPLLAPESEVWTDARDKLAASLYRQAEQALELGQQTVAIERYLQVITDTPEASFRPQAQFAAADLLLMAQRWPEAIDWLTDFRQRFADNALVAVIPAKLADAYQQTGQWQLAADELMQMVASPDSEAALQQQSLLLAAELYLRAGDQEAARLAYRRYANTYSEPLAALIEAQYQLAAIYQQQGNGDNRRFWLRRIIATDASAGTERTERSRYLAAEASLVLADDVFAAFVAVSLRQPLKTSLQRKRKRLEDALSAYQETIAYGVETFATRATYQIGQLYATLADQLLATSPPPGLDALAVEQYQILLEEQAFPLRSRR